MTDNMNCDLHTPLPCVAASQGWVEEAAQAVAGLRSAADLDARAGVLLDREEVAPDTLAAFLVPVPQGYTSQQAAAFKREVSASLAQIVADAESQVAYLTMWDKLEEAINA